MSIKGSIRNERKKLDAHSWKDKPHSVVRDVGLGVILLALCSFFLSSTLPRVFDVSFLFGYWTMRPDPSGQYLGPVKTC